MSDTMDLGYLILFNNEYYDNEPQRPEPTENDTLSCLFVRYFKSSEDARKCAKEHYGFKDFNVVHFEIYWGNRDEKGKTQNEKIRVFH